MSSTHAAGHGKKQTPLGVPWKGEPVTISKKVYDTKKIDFLPHENWLGMELDYQYVAPVAKALNTTEIPLLTRGESHITVVTPPEFDTLATANVTIEEINQIALDYKIQKSKFKMICLGKEAVKVDNDLYIVYQIIVDAPNLEAIREAIFRLYVNKGGNSALFDPNAFWPHITVAFTIGDLFENNGVYKGLNVCHSPLKITRHG
ncbi:hypothetical protein BDA99DRAFT_560811 [Phascolomyces articulosus]|uniref:Swiss Army Knife 2H phosphoesterase domain-containing protein n=1 Tax=Phascolomyces articulosus TaxID=60185 RepID=A0AAD5PCY6_9FUNG|nr:hypothetical protein BDA99DRAFT_560811 [Phascolomyces articulosus]